MSGQNTLSKFPMDPTYQPTPNDGRACCRCSKLWEVVVGWVALPPWVHRVHRAPRQRLVHREPVHRAQHLGPHPQCREHLELGRGAKSKRMWVPWRELKTYWSYNILHIFCIRIFISLYRWVLKFGTFRNSCKHLCPSRHVADVLTSCWLSAGRGGRLDIDLLFC